MSKTPETVIASTIEPWRLTTDHKPYPNAHIVQETTDRLLQLLYPEQLIADVYKLPESLHTIGVQTYRSLKQEIEKAQTHTLEHQPSSAKDIALSLLDSLKSIRTALRLDIQAAFDNDPAATSHSDIIIAYPTFKAVAMYRLAHALEKMDTPTIPRMMTEYGKSITGIDINPGASIDESFFIDHGTGVVIGQTAVIGKRVTLYQGVTLGAFHFPRHEDGQLIRNTKRHPTIEDDVTIYSNTSILGDVTIGARSTIGANVQLSENVPSDSIVTREKPSLRMKAKH